MLQERRDVDFNIAGWSECKDVKSWGLFDAKSMRDSLGKDLGSPHDSRVIELMPLKQLLTEARVTS